MGSRFDPLRPFTSSNVFQALFQADLKTLEFRPRLLRKRSMEQVENQRAMINFINYGITFALKVES